MVNEVIRIKCPWCNAVLSVKNRPDIATKNVTCPLCKQKSAFTQFTIMNDVQQQPVQMGPQGYPNQGQQMPQYGYGNMANPYEGTRYQSVGNIQQQQPMHDAPYILHMQAQLTIMESGVIMSLKPGRNVIGRRAQGSTADFQIDTQQSKRMSRQHIVIETSVLTPGQPTYTVSLAKELCNPVMVNNQQLQYGDKIILTPGSIITLPDATLEFDFPDPESTVI